MYYQYFGLNEAPFSIAVNPRYLFMSPRHRDALAHLLYGVGAGGGFILLTGEVGTGKTTINRCLLEQLPDNTDIAIILNPALSAAELLASACDELGIDYGDGSASLKTLTDRLHSFLLENHVRGRNTVLLIDEAQHLDFEVLEQIRLLTNLETNSEKLLQIILIGQPELAQMLARPELRQLNQRITARYNLEPLNPAETAAYIRHRLQVAGLAPSRELFPMSVVKGVHKRTRGIPRLINLLCDRMLLGAYGKGASRVDKTMLAQAAREVMGETADSEAPGGARWGIAAAALLLVAAGLVWWQWDFWATRQAPAPVTSAIATAESPLTVATPVPAEPAVASGTSQAVAPTPEVSAPAAWLLPPDMAMATLWSLSTDQPIPGDPCGDRGGLRCGTGTAATWNELGTMNRPLLLEAVTPERFAAGILLLGVDGRQAWVAVKDGVEQVALAELAQSWRGGYQYLWRPPTGFDRPLALGDTSPAVGEIAMLFARLDGQPQPLAGDLFTDALRTRVRLFQSANGLASDGVIGERTLLKLNEQLGIDPTAESARKVLKGGPRELVSRTVL